MQKPLALSIAALLGFAGCQVFEKSPTWEQAARVQPAETTRDPDPSSAYARKLHSAFAGSGVEHKVVVYQYRYRTRLREEAIGTRTAVVYRDESDPRHPWWLKDDRSMKPFWLPNGSLDKQISFYLRRKAEVLEQTEFPASRGDGKTSIAFARSAPRLRVAVEPPPAPPARKIAQAKKAPEPIITAQRAPQKMVKAAPKPAPKVAAAPKATAQAVKSSTPKANPLATSIGSFFSPPASQLSPAPHAPVAATSTVRWSPPEVLDAGQQSDLTAPRDTHSERLFRAKHGSDYNRFSPTDRRKMQRLQQGLASAE